MTSFEQIASKFILSTALITGTLPAAEPQPPTPQGPTKSQDKKDWTRDQIFEKIGELSSTCDMIDQFFKAHPERSKSENEWAKESARFRALSEQARTTMSEKPSSAIINLTGISLESGNSALKLFLTSLIEEGNTRKESAAQFPAVVGMYNESDFVGMQMAAKTLQDAYKQHLKSSGKPPSPIETKVMAGIDKMSSARTPRELSESLQPMISEFVLALAQDRSPGSNGVRESFTKLLSEISPKHTSENPQLEKNDSAEKNWMSWNSFLTKELRHRLAIGGKIARAETLTQDLAKTEHGLKVIAFGASQLSSIYKNSKPDLSTQLEEIAKVTSKEQFDKIPNGVRVFAEAAVRAQIAHETRK